MSRTSLFLARSSYKRRRAMDAARILPLLGAVLFMLPVLGESGGTRGVGLYLFIVWAVLVGLAAGLSHVLAAPQKGGSGGAEGASAAGAEAAGGPVGGPGTGHDGLSADAGSAGAGAAGSGGGGG